MKTPPLDLDQLAIDVMALNTHQVTSLKVMLQVEEKTHARR